MRARDPNQETGIYDGAFILAAVGVALFIAVWYVATHRYYLLNRQFIEALGYLAIPATGLGCLTWLILTGHARRENAWPHPYQVISPKKDERLSRDAWRKDAVVLGYDVHGKPWLWPDRIRVMQGLVLGLTGMGKTTLLKNIITQDLMRVIHTPEGPKRMPILILDGKGERKFFEELLPHIHHAGRLQDLRVINPSWPDISVRYNPFHCTQDDYMPVVNMVFGSFNLHDEFFGKHQLNYLADIVRVLVYTGRKFNFYDVLVMAIDPEVLQEQVAKAIHETTRMPNMTLQRRLNFEMSVKNLYQSFQDRERVPKIQGLLNECMTFLDDELSIITGPYEDLLSLDEVIEKGLILFLSLNVNKNTEPVRALGKMLLQNVQLVVGRRYEADHRCAACRPMTSIILDEFAPFGYQNFAHILQTARGTNTSFLFSMQSVPQLLKVGRGFKDDVTSAANTIITFKTHDETTADFFLQASALHPVTKRTRSVRRVKFFGYEKYRVTGAGSEREDLETRALDYHIKNLPAGQIELLMTDETRGTLHTTLSVRPPADIRVPGFEPEVFPRLTASRAESNDGAHLRFRNLEFASRHGRRATTGWGGRVLRRAGCVAFCILSLTVPIMAQTHRSAPRPQPARPASTYDPAGRGGLYRETWYDAMLRQFNPDKLDWGQWLEQRRQAFLEQTAANPYFKYGLLTTLLLVLLTVALAKALIDKSRVKWLAQERYNDLKRHDQSSRQAVRDAIRKYNEHMEKCNRVVEAGLIGHAVTAQTFSGDGGELTLPEALTQLAEVRRARDDFSVRLEKANAVVGELSMRVNGVQAGSNGSTGGNGSRQGGASTSDLVKQINDLREQLYRERERNKHLKGM
jgi:hypothetical protein